MLCIDLLVFAFISRLRVQSTLILSRALLDVFFRTAVQDFDLSPVLWKTFIFLFSPFFRLFTARLSFRWRSSIASPRRVDQFDQVKVGATCTYTPFSFKKKIPFLLFGVLFYFILFFSSLEYKPLDLVDVLMDAFLSLRLDRPAFSLGCGPAGTRWGEKKIKSGVARLALCNPPKVQPTVGCRNACV